MNLDHTFAMNESYTSPTRQRRNLHASSSPRYGDYASEKLSSLSPHSFAHPSPRILKDRVSFSLEKECMLVTIKERPASPSPLLNHTLLLRMTLMSLAAALALSIQCSIFAFSALPETQGLRHVMKHTIAANATLSGAETSNTRASRNANSTTAPLIQRSVLSEPSHSELTNVSRSTRLGKEEEQSASAIPDYQSDRREGNTDVNFESTPTISEVMNQNAESATGSTYRYAYTYVVGGCDPAHPVYRNFLYNIMINTQNMRQDGSKADVIVFVQMAFASSESTLTVEDERLMSVSNIQLRYIPPVQDEGFDQLMMEKFRVLGLTKYERVVSLDADILLRGSLDYLLDLSVKGILKRNIVFAGRYVPAAGGLFVVTPGNFDLVKEIVSRAKSDAVWNTEEGWGHAFKDDDQFELLSGKKGKSWDFSGSSKDQGLLYHWTKFVDKSVSIVMRGTILNYGCVTEQPDGDVRLLNTLTLEVLSGLSTPRICWDDVMGHKPCQPPHIDFVNFSGTKKPWLNEPPANFVTNPEESPAHFWFDNLASLNAKLHMGLNLDRWQPHQRPLYGYQEVDESTAKTMLQLAVNSGETMATPKFIPSEVDTPTADFAFTYVVGGCDPKRPAYRNFINNILINTLLQREEGSKADVMVFFQMSYSSVYDQLPDEDAQVLRKMDIRITYIPKCEHESYGRLMFDKFRILGLTKYKRVFFMDADIMVRGSFDYLFELSMKGVLKQNVVFSGRVEPALGGLFMLAPKQGDWDQMMEIVREKERRSATMSPPYFDEVLGWGRPFGEAQTYELIGGKKHNVWDFQGASSDQGLLYSWVRFGNHQTVSVIQKDTIQNYVDGDLAETHDISIIAGNAPTRECWTASLSHKPCVPPHSDYVHFQGYKRKPFIVGPPADLFDVNATESPTHFWFRTLAKVNDNLGLGLNFSHWENNLKPLLGVRSHDHSLAGTTYAESSSSINFMSPYTSYKRDRTGTSQFAYAYVVGGCKPEDPSYRNYFNDILVSTYLQREEGSKSDVVVFVQMAFESSFDALPDTDVKLLSTADILIQYIPKAKDESFYRIMMDKFRVLTLTQYERVLFMDADVMALGNLDYLFDLSVRGVLKKNLVVAGKIEPANGGFFMLTPSQGSSDRLMAIIRDKEVRGAQLPYPHWDPAVGWGHTIADDDYYEALNGIKKKQWDFYGAFADQGLLYHFTKYEQQSVSIIFRNTVQNWDLDVSTGKVHLEQTLDIFDVFGNTFDSSSMGQPTSEQGHHLRFHRHCWKEVMTHKPCIAPHNDFIHFTGPKGKPWLRGPPDDLATVPSSTSPWHFWFATLSVLNDKMQMGLDFTNWRSHHRPTLGMFPTFNDAASTTYAISAVNESMSLSTDLNSNQTSPKSEA